MSASPTASLPGLPGGVAPYDWGLEQLRVPQAHEVTRGSHDVVVAVIDLGYRHHPDMDGHLWCNPKPGAPDVHGWDFADDDASLEYSGAFMADTDYYRGHHVFVAGEVAAVAPECPVMIVRVGYSCPDSWWQGIRYAVDNGARVLVIPHGYLTGRAATGTAWFYQGTDFNYPTDNPGVPEALDYAYDKGCLVCRGTAGNRGRRVASANSALESVVTVGSTNRRDEPADICCSADYVEVGTPGGQRHSSDERDRVWGCGGDSNYIPFTGGCMASGFAGAVAALVWSRFPHLANHELRQLLRNSARRGRKTRRNADGWDPMLGYGILDAAAAVALDPARLRKQLALEPDGCKLRTRRGKPVLRVALRNEGAFDVEGAIAVAYDGDPQRPAVPEATPEKSVILQTRQLGHAITPVRGLHGATVDIALTEPPGEAVWLEAYCLDRGEAGKVVSARVAL